MRTKYRVKIAYDRTRVYPWRFMCEGCGYTSLSTPSAAVAHDLATSHAARCEDLHWLNWQAACPSCCKTAYGGVIAPACPACQGYGWVKEAAA